MLEPKRFLQDMRSSKVKQLCVILSEHDCVTDIRSELIFTDNERFLSSLSMDESLLDEKGRIQRYTSQPWESLTTNPSHESSIIYKHVFL